MGARFIRDNTADPLERCARRSVAFAANGRCFAACRFGSRVRASFTDSGCDRYVLAVALSELGIAAAVASDAGHDGGIPVGILMLVAAWLFA